MDRIDRLESDHKHLRKRFDMWQELREMDMDVYENIKKSVYENTEMIDLIKKFLAREHSFNARKELEIEKKRKETAK